MMLLAAICTEQTQVYYFSKPHSGQSPTDSHEHKTSSRPERCTGAADKKEILHFLDLALFFNGSTCLPLFLPSMFIFISPALFLTYNQLPQVAWVSYSYPFFEVYGHTMCHVYILQVLLYLRIQSFLRSIKHVLF